MKPYEKYKDSGFNWASKIPIHWVISSLKYKVSYEKGANAGLYTKEFLADNSGNIPVYSGQTANEGIMGYVNRTDYELTLGLLVTTVGAKAMTVRKVTGRFCLSQNCALFTEKQADIQLGYYHYLLSILFEDEKKKLPDIMQPSLRFEDLDKFKILLPPKAEQTAIANYLDHQTAIIDELIEKKTKQIALLKEKRQAIINETVTKGLDPTAKMKDSGIEWLGEIPESWEIVRLRYLGKCQNGVSQGSEYFGSGDPFVNYSDVYKNIALPQSVTGLAKSTDADKENYSVIEGDIFFTRTSETVEEIGLSSICLNTIENAVFAGFLIRFRPIPNVLDKDFSKYYFRSHIPRVYFVKEMNLVTRASLSQELLKSLPVLLPSLNEQKELAKFLDSQVEKMNNAMLDIESAVQKLKEYRQSLISEAVTGKIDVREWQKN